jgi:hypothetical protein
LKEIVLKLASRRAKKEKKYTFYCLNYSQLLCTPVRVCDSLNFVAVRDSTPRTFCETVRSFSRVFEINWQTSEGNMRALRREREMEKHIDSILRTFVYNVSFNNGNSFETLKIYLVD